MSKRERLDLGSLYLAGYDAAYVDLPLRIRLKRELDEAIVTRPELNSVQAEGSERSILRMSG